MITGRELFRGKALFAIKGGGECLKQRIELLDLWRSLCLCVMIVFHLCYDLALFGVISMEAMASLPARLLSYDVGGCFILISGICLRFSRDPVRRGFFVFCAGLLVSLVTGLVKQPVLFGILQCIGICMMLCGVLRKKLEGRLGVGFALICLALFAVTWWATSTITVNIRFLFPIGLRTGDFYSADYYPLFPWLFLYLIGMVFGKKLDEHRESAVVQWRFPRWMTFPGRHSLLIYLLHQPVLYGLTWLMFG